METRTTNILRFLERITGWDLKELSNQTSYHGTVGGYMDAKELFDISNYIESGDYNIAYEKEIIFLKDFVREFRLHKDFDQLITECKETGHILLESYEIFKEYREWMIEEKEHFRNYLFNNEFLKEEEKTEEFLDSFNYEWVDRAKKSVQNKLLQVYNFGNASGTNLSIGHTVPYSISDALCVSDDINICIGANKGENDEMCYVRIALKIDRELAFSHFIITIQYKDRIWLVTDKPEMPNPQFRNKVRNADRWREDAFEKIQLPYGILNLITEWRKESKALSKDNGSEVYIKSIKDFLPPASKILIKLIVEELIYNIIPMKQSDLKRIGFAGENIRLIGTNVELKDNVFVDINKEANDDRVNNIVYPTSTELVKVDPIKTVTKYVEAGELCTVDEIRSIAIWSQKEEERKNKQELLNKAYTEERMKSDEEELNKVLFDNIERLYEVMFSGDKVYMCIEDDKSRTFGTPVDQATILNICDTDGIFKSKYSSFSVVDYHIHTFKRFAENCRCAICDCAATGSIDLTVYTYKELCGILGIDRNRLPYTFQNYTSRYYMPYYGNDILNSVNPEYMIVDPRSRIYEHYYNISIPLNKRCYNKLRKKYRKFDKSLVIINYTNKTIRIEEYKDGK